MHMQWITQWQLNLNTVDLSDKSDGKRDIIELQMVLQTIARVGAEFWHSPKPTWGSPQPSNCILIDAHQKRPTISTSWGSHKLTSCRNTREQNQYAPYPKYVGWTPSLLLPRFQRIMWGQYLFGRTRYVKHCTVSSAVTWSKVRALSTWVGVFAQFKSSRLIQRAPGCVQSRVTSWCNDVIALQNS